MRRYRDQFYGWLASYRDQDFFPGGNFGDQLAEAGFGFSYACNHVVTVVYIPVLVKKFNILNDTIL